MRRGLTLILILLVSGCQAGGLQGFSALTASIEPEAEALAGKKAAPALELRFGGVLDDSPAVDRLQEVGLELAASSPELIRPWSFAVLASDKINAFSLPGGLVYITSGLYEKIGDRDGLIAAVIAHEMAHVVSKDSLKPSCSNADQALNRETDADRGGVQYLSAAGYPANHMIELLELIEDAQPAGWAEIRVKNLTNPHNALSDIHTGSLALR